MLKVNVGLSRKLSRDFNSTGFSVHLEGEVCVPMDQPDHIIEKIKELYDLAEESLQQQIDRYQSDSAMAGRDETPTVATTQPPVNRLSQRNQSSPASHSKNTNQETNRDKAGESEFIPATNKQIQFLLNLGKRNGLTKPQLEKRVVQIVNREVGLYDLSKQEAGRILNQLSQESSSTATRHR